MFLFLTTAAALREGCRRFWGSSRDAVLPARIRIKRDSSDPAWKMFSTPLVPGRGIELFHETTNEDSNLDRHIHEIGRSLGHDQ